MPALRFITEKIFGPVQVYVTRPKLPLAAEIIFQLNNIPGIKIVNHGEKADILIHLIGFDDSEYAETLSHTSELHAHLDKALQNRAKFILVKTKNFADLGRAAITMVSQFGRLFKLTYTILETDQASEVIKTFVHGFVPVKAMPAGRQVVEKLETHTKFWLFIILFFALALFQLTFVFGIKQWQTNQDKLRTGVFWNYFLSVNSVFAPIPKIVWEKRGGNFEALKSKQNQINAYADGYKSYLASWEVFWQRPEIQTLEQVQDRLRFLLEKASFLQTVSDNEDLNKTRTKLSKINAIFSEIPYLLGLKSQVRYLVLSQNSKGEITEVNLAVVENGKVISSKNYKSEFLDGLLVGEVIPPSDFKTATGISKWGIRYVNWDPDFNQVAVKAAWFISKQLNVGIDVVVGTSLDFSELEKMSMNSLLDKLESRQISVVNLHETHSQLGKVGWNGGIDTSSDFLYNKNTSNLPYNSWLDIQIKSGLVEHTFKAVFSDDKNYWRILTPTKMFSGQSKTAEVSYSTPFNVNNNSYRLLIPNQPGVFGGNLRVNIKFDPAWKVIVSEKAVVAMPGELEYNTDLSYPFIIDLTFNK